MNSGIDLSNRISVVPSIGKERNEEHHMSNFGENAYACPDAVSTRIPSLNVRVATKKGSASVFGSKEASDGAACLDCRKCPWQRPSPVLKRTQPLRLC